MKQTEFWVMVRNGEIVSLLTQHGLGLVYKDTTDLTDCKLYAVTEQTGLQHWKHNTLVDT